MKTLFFLIFISILLAGFAPFLIAFAFGTPAGIVVSICTVIVALLSAK